VSWLAGMNGMLTPMPKPAAETRPCACGCGELTTGTWRRGHWARGEGGYDPAEHGPAERLLPGPGDEIDLGDLDPAGLDEIDGPSPAEQDWIDRHGGEAARAAANRVTDLPAPDEPEEIPADPAPGPIRDRGGKGRKAAAPRVTVATRKDIEAKFGLMVEIPGRIWATRDPYCGGMFLQQAPDISAVAVDLIVQSPDLVAWFTGVGGGFMLWLNLITACQPVLYTVWAHHIAHAIDDQQPGPAQADTAQYAA
jgi:hypothetical protein